MTRAIPRPSREEVYHSWLRVQKLEKDLKEAVNEHTRLANLRYKDNSTQLLEDMIQLGIPDSKPLA